MKVRIISKGEALPYYSCKPLQIAMHTVMRAMPCFSLIGRPLSPTDLVEISEDAGLNDEWFSIDYSAATDGLSWRYSGRIFEYIISDLPEELKAVARQVLGPHELYYPTMRGKENKLLHPNNHWGLQANGQLMGSPLSFPVLCLANLGLYLRVTRLQQMGWEPERRLRAVRINGDDMLYTAPPSMWKEHVETGELVGLRMSVGKAYNHSEFAVINSVMHHMDLKRYPRASPFQIDYLNTGLFYGQHKVQTNSKETIKVSDTKEEVQRKRLIPNINTVLQGSLPGRAGDLLRGDRKSVV